MTLPDKLLAVHRSLKRARIRHAFGGAIALAYCTLDPRGTSDIDVNIFVPAQKAGPALRALPDGVSRTPEVEDVIARDGQIRLWWGETPLDLFFDYAPVHSEAAAHSRHVPFEDTVIPVLGPVELAVFKAMFDRTRDWADIEAMVAAGTLDTDAVREQLRRLGAEDRLSRLDDAVDRAQRA